MGADGAPIDTGSRLHVADKKREEKRRGDGEGRGKNRLRLILRSWFTRL